MVRRATLGCRSRRDDRWYSDRPIAGGRPAPEVVYIGVRRGGTLASTHAATFASASIRNLRSTSTTIGDYSPCGYRQKSIESVSFDPSSVEGIEARDTNGFAGGIVGGCWVRHRYRPYRSPRCALAASFHLQPSCYMWSRSIR